MFQTKVIQNIGTNILCSITFFSKNRAVCEKMWKSVTARLATNDNMMHAFAYQTTKQRIQMHPHNIQYFLLFHNHNGYVNTPQCYVTGALPVLFCYDIGCLLHIISKVNVAVQKQILSCQFVCEVCSRTWCDTLGTDLSKSTCLLPIILKLWKLKKR